MKLSGHNLGRFDVAYEFSDITDGIQRELTNVVGNLCQWWVFDQTATVKDPIYDVGDTGDPSIGGRRWKSPVTIPVYSAFWNHGTVMQSDRGYYNTDVLRLSFNRKDAIDKIPDLFSSPDLHAKDRIVYEGQVYRPTNLQPRGLLVRDYLIASISLHQIMPDEMVNDDQFLSYV